MRATAVKRSGVGPIASGEHEPDDPGYLDLICTLSVDFVQMDIVVRAATRPRACFQRLRAAD